MQPLSNVLPGKIFQYSAVDPDRSAAAFSRQERLHSATLIYQTFLLARLSAGADFVLVSGAGEKVRLWAKVFRFGQFNLFSPSPPGVHHFFYKAAKNFYVHRDIEQFRYLDVSHF